MPTVLQLEDALVALVLELKLFFVVYEARDYNVFVLRLRHDSLSLTRFAWGFDKRAKPFASLTSLLLFKQRIFLYACSFAAVAGKAGFAGCFFAPVTSFTDYITRIAQLMREIILLKENLFYLHRHFQNDIIPIKVHRIFCCVLLSFLISFLFFPARSLFPHVEELFVDKVIVLHVPLLATFPTPPLDLFWVQLVFFRPPSVDAYTCKIEVVFLSFIIIYQGLISNLQLFKLLKIVTISCDLWVVVLYLIFEAFGDLFLG